MSNDTKIKPHHDPSKKGERWQLQFAIVTVYQLCISIKFICNNNSKKNNTVNTIK